MPEIAEVSRIVHFLRLHVVGKTITKAIAPDDANIFGKVGTSGPDFVKAVTGKKVVSAGSQGKYFWLILDRPPHVLMHFGMTGWLHIREKQTSYTNLYRRMKPEEREMWPPKFWKFHLFTDDPDVEVAYTDPRRFGRIRLINCSGSEIRKHPPLSENGPDPVVDPDVFTYEYLLDKTRHRHVPIKALLLDQAMISGIGNWVGDEVMYHARLHPEQYCDEFSDEEIQKLYDSIRYVCQTAVDNLADSDKFPEEWLFRHRWNKGSKDAANTLPTGEKLSFITVGGRTSCFVPKLQRKTGHIPAGAKEESIEQAEAKSTKKSTKQQSASVTAADEATGTSDKKQVPRRGQKAKQGVTNGADVKAEDESKTPRMKRKRAETNQTAKAEASDSPPAMQRVKSEGPSSGRRRSGRLSAKGP